MSRLSRTLRRLSILLVVSAALVTAAIVALVQFDLNQYRPELEQQLSASLGQPVKIGRAHMAIHNGLAVDLDQVEIGADDSSFHLSSPLLFAQLHLRPLLWGELRFSRLRLVQPQIRLHLRGTTETVAFTQERIEELTAALSSVNAETLEVANAKVEITSDAPQFRPFLADLSLRLNHWTADSDGAFQLFGQLHQEKTTASVEAEATLPNLQALQEWREAPLRFQAVLKNYRLDIEGHALPCPSPCIIDQASLNVAGTPATGLAIHLDAQLNQGAKASFLPARIAGRWISREDSDQLRDFLLRISDSELSGELTWQRSPTSQLKGKLSSDYFNLNWLKSLVPESALTRVDGGHLHSFSVAFDSPLPLKGQPTIAMINQLDGRLNIPRIELRDSMSLKEVEARFSTDNETIRLTEGTAQLLDYPLRFSGQLSDVETDAPRYQATLEGNVNLQEVPALPKDVKLTGIAPLRIDIEGQGARWTLRGASDFSQSAILYPPLLKKRTGHTATLKATANNGKTFTLTLDAPPVIWRLDGQFKQSEEVNRLILSSSPINLQNLRPLSPIMRDLKARGMVDGTIALRVDSEHAIPEDATLNLQGVGFHLYDVVADFDGLTGQLRLADNRLTIPPMQALWGTEPVTLQGVIPDMQQPVAELRVKAKRLKANSLIFSSPTAILQDLDGRVLASEKGLEFAPVKVTLKGGTKARVTGTVTDFSFPKTDLHVDATYGNIDEVIDLFVDPDDEPSDPSEPPGYAPVVVTVDARKGHLGDLRFTGAKGTVTNKERKVIVEPLRFTTGKGTVDGSVVYDYGVKGLSRLDVRGKVEKVDADRIYRKFFKEKGLVTGKLSGDFSLTGRGTGDTFLRTSDGHFQARINKGVLRKFKTLSKVFSFLNVSQVFKGNIWPDMDKDGMPFNIAEGSFTLKQGVLRTENLRVDGESMNLSLLGDIDLRANTLDLILGVKPLVTVDRVISRIPLAGWLLTGDDKALVMAHYQIKGSQQEPVVTPIPGTSVSKKVLGIFERVLTLPGKVVTDPGRVLIGPDMEQNPGGEPSIPGE